MLDAFNLPKDFRGDVQIFGPGDYGNGLSWQTWRRPRGCSMGHFITIGGGPGGGGGFSAAAGNPRGGGAGAASAAMSRLTIALDLLPSVIYAFVGVGGGGGAPGVAGANASPSYLALMPNLSTVANYILINSGNGNAGANPGTAGAGGGGQAAQSASSIGVNPVAGLGIYSFIGGQAGASGGAHTGAIGSPVAIPTSGTLCQAGAGGAGVTAADFAGGLHTPIAPATTVSYITQHLPPGAAAGSNNGNDGITLWKPFFGMGGGGGSSSNAGVGGNGGNAGIGGGGGGGGGGTTGGRGGNGGPGAIIIICW
jgi:hypothetical protein